MTTTKKVTKKRVSKKDVQRELYKRSFHTFFKDAFKVLRADIEYVDNFHIKFLCDTLQEEIERMIAKRRKEKDICINVPPRSTKTLIISVILPVWAWIKAPSLDIVTISYAATLAERNSHESKILIESQWFKSLFGDLFQIRQDQNSKANYMNDKGGTRKAVGIEGGIMGFNSDITILDDAQDKDQANSSIYREKVNTQFSETIANRLNDPRYGIIINLQQRLHPLDLSGYLLERNPERWYHINLPAICNDSVTPSHLKEHYVDGLFDPVRLDQGILDYYKKELGTVGFSGQYMQNPVPSEGIILKRSWFKVISTKEFYEIVGEKNYSVNFTCDLAYTSDKKNDPSAILAYTSINKTIYVFNVAIAWKEFVELKKWIKEFCMNNRYTSNSRVYIEGAGPGKSMISELQRNDDAGTRLNTIELDKPRISKEARAVSKSAFIESGGVILVEGLYVDDFLSEVCGFPKAPHDDRLDTLLFAIDKSNSSGVWDFRFS
ncbi:putative phage terminase large subunit-like protein [Catalinimonas alkaloidigena]|uniref:hypothetical protein n=1 Tax=Catalinimonas alkaloidigena TaxID=1075417 RepID=UPI002404B9C8|nr:hypothetical protein [Catalinimonas alkaloidigena]MDF9800795.1 putative phage terminase large subunit-like protein [Catalinimonas alkaloidigena]